MLGDLCVHTGRECSCTRAADRTREEGRQQGRAEAIADLRSDATVEAAQRALADEWHQDSCGCGRWPSACVTKPGNIWTTPLGSAPGLWSMGFSAHALARHLEAQTKPAEGDHG